MKKLLFKICSLTLIFCLLFSGCTNANDNPSNGDSTGKNPSNTIQGEVVNSSKLPDVEGTVHVYNMSETGKYVVENGASSYKILVPQGKADAKHIADAASDLRVLFEEATGVKLEIVEDSENLPEGKYLSIGNTSLVKEASVDVTRETLGKGGFRIETYNDSVLMAGYTDEASMYAVYAFLEKALGFEQYFTDFYTLDKGVKNLKLMDYDVIDIPDFEYRIQQAGYIRWDAANIRRMRWTEQESLFIPADEKSATWHNTMVYFPKETYQDENPEFYSYPKADQLCYTARGNQEKYEQMIDICAERIEYLFSLDKYKDSEWVTVSIEDNQNCCACDTCAEAKKIYGADSGVIVKFLNDVSKKVEAWMETEEGLPYKREEFKIFFFAYHATNAAPVKFNEATNEYVPVDESVVCDEHVVPYFAETNGDYLNNFHDEGTANTVVGKNMRGWAALADELYFWSYSTNFRHFLSPYNSFDNVQDILKFSKQNKTVYGMIQDQWTQAGTQTGFGVFKNWLHAKLLWDVNADVEALTKQFFNAYFKDAADTMLDLYYEWRVWAQYQTEELGYNGYRSVYINTLKKELWPQRLLTKWIGMIDKASSEIEHYRQADPNLYAKLKKFIDVESLSFKWLLLELYSDQYSDTTLKGMVNDFTTIITNSGMTLMNSLYNESVSTYLKKWE